MTYTPPDLHFGETRMRRIVGILLIALGVSLFVVVQPTAAVAQQGETGTTGEEIFAANCTRCHADDGSGVQGLGRPLFGVASEAGRDQHTDSVTNGRGGMPAFGDSLSEEEIDQVVGFVRLTFRSSGGADAAPAPADPAPAAPAEPEAVQELPRTGAETPLVAIAGITLVVAGLQLVVFSRRRDS